MGRVFVLAALCLPGIAFAQASPPVESWATLESDEGNAIGWVRTQRLTEATGTRQIETSLVRVREGEGPVQTLKDTTERVYGAQGELRSIQHISESAGRKVRLQAVFGAQGLEISRTASKTTHSLRLPYPPGWTGEDEPSRIRTWSPASQPVLTFPAFSLSGQSFEQVEITPAPSADKPGALQRLAREDGQLRSVSLLERDAEGRLLTTTRPLFGTQIRLRRTDRKTAQRRGTPFSMDHAGLTKFPYRITDAAKRGHIRYTLRFKNGIPFPIPQTGEQRATIRNDRLVLDLCAGCGPGMASDAETLAHATRTTPWLQADAPLIKSLARSGVDSEATGQARMERLMVTARRKLPKTDYAGHYSALEAVRRGAGDCTEDAVVLAALARAAGIPALVASGLVYSKDRHHGLSNVFMPHSWVLAYVDGQWKSFDISLGSFDATHIALTVGDGDARSIFAAGQLATLIEWEAMTEVRKRPAETPAQPVGVEPGSSGAGPSS